MKRPQPSPVPCPNGCDADAWDIEQNGQLHFIVCPRFALEAKPRLGFFGRISEWLRAVFTEESDT